MAVSAREKPEQCPVRGGVALEVGCEACSVRLCSCNFSLSLAREKQHTVLLLLSKGEAMKSTSSHQQTQPFPAQQTHSAGISNRPPLDEDQQQRQLPPRGQAKKDARPRSRSRQWQKDKG